MFYKHSFTNIYIFRIINKTYWRFPYVKYVIIFLSVIISFGSYGQSNEDRPSVFLDCQMRCFSDYLKQEITFVNYKFERQGADVYVLLTSQRASAGAEEIQLIFQYDGYNNLTSDTISYIKEANISNNNERELLKKSLKKGLLVALTQTSLLDDITYNLPVDTSTSVSETIDDPWNYWSFNTSMNLNVNGEKSFSEQRYFLRFSASQVTEDHKIISSSWYDFNKSKFTLSDGEEVKSQNKRYRSFFQYVKSISDHWSVGVRSLAGSSSFSNTDFEFFLRPAIEYNLYPYSENITRRLTFLYSAGLVHQNYTEVTIFDKLKETLARHSLDIEYQITQKWGDINMDIEFDQYLHDLELYSISFNPNVELNIIKGLRLNFGGFFSFVGDRISITKEEISDQDIILQNRQLNTSYSYFSYFGFNYRFGSANNNIVNPRF